MLLVVSVFVVMSVGCAQRQALEQPRPSSKPYDWQKEGDIPPLDSARTKREVDRVDSFEDLSVDEDSLAFDGVENIEEIAEPLGADESSVIMDDGYRVQVFATADQARAEKVREDAAYKLGIAAYVLSEDGVYKVRAGDCLAREQADLLRTRCQQVGYADAWVVATRIVIGKRIPVIE